MTARRALLANASFTAVSGVVLITAREALYPLFALSSPLLLTSIGLILLLYAGTLVIEARRDPPQRYALLTAAVLDAGWVVGSVIVLLLAWPALAPAGRALIIAAALIVEVFALLQFRASRTIALEPAAEARR
jgi:hypothetical protein